jgi:hypothetical protein
MLVHFFEDAGLVAPLEELLDSDEFVVTTCPLEVTGVGEKAKAAAVPPPTSDPVNPTAVIACLSFRRM